MWLRCTAHPWHADCGATVAPEFAAPHHRRSAGRYEEDHSMPCIYRHSSTRNRFDCRRSDTHSRHVSPHATLAATGAGHSGIDSGIISPISGNKSRLISHKSGTDTASTLHLDIWNQLVSPRVAVRTESVSVQSSNNKLSHGPRHSFSRHEDQHHSLGGFEGRRCLVLSRLC